jgi:GNAT superfamily N-acetyltransferase
MGAELEYVPVDLAVHRAQMIDLTVEYLSWVAEQMDAYFQIDTLAMMGMPVRDYVTRSIDKVCADVPPCGITYLIKLDSTVVGMGGLRQIRDRVGELKRMYIRPAYRGRGFGVVLLRQLLQMAHQFSYRAIYLDSGPFMTTAHQLYREHGFVDRGEYPETEAPESLRPRWVFMEKTLAEP